MSGHVILVPLKLTNVDCIAAVIGFRASVLEDGTITSLSTPLRRVVIQRNEEAHCRAAEEKARIDSWREFLARQEQYLEAHRDLEAAIETAERSMGDIALDSPDEARAAKASDETGYGALGRTPESLRPSNEEILEDLTEVIVSLPQVLRTAEHSPYEAIRRQYERLAGRVAGGQTLNPWEATEFRRAVAHSIERFLRDARNRARQRQRIRERIEVLLDKVLVHKALAPPAFAEAVADMGQAISRLMSSDAPQVVELDLIEKRMVALVESIKAESARLMRLDALSDALERNLTDMGYATQTAPALHESGRMQEMAMRIPGGELVRLAVHDDGRLGFEVCHEQHGEQHALTDDDRAQLRKQEARWCEDFRLLVRRMIVEGFEYEVRFEARIPDDAIKVVVVEHVDDLVSNDTERRRRPMGGIDDMCLS